MVSFVAMFVPKILTIITLGLFTQPRKEGLAVQELAHYAVKRRQLPGVGTSHAAAHDIGLADVNT